MAKGSNAQPENKDWSKDRKGAFDFVFNTHYWGNRANAGKNYRRNVKK